MKKLNISLSNPTGLHARPAKNFVNLVKDYAAEISVFYNGKKANGKSLISLLTLGAESGANILVEINGEDEETVFATLKECIDKGLLEE
ncbi:MAG TPA: HPr family phosphocarrier protein [Anaerolineaceae bacterium]|jgi:phosphotransferase system HPr (HPr) family protein|nr:HPr family phosphocarrier protein [Anaerolineaceae bacterium]